MKQFMMATIIEQIQIATPYIFSVVVFALFTWLMCYITEVRVNRRWLHDPANMDRTVQDNLKEKDDKIKGQAMEIAAYKMQNERMSAVIRGVKNRVEGAE